MRKELLRLLKENARISTAEISSRLQLDEDAVKKAIKEMEKENIIKGYAAIINEDMLEDSCVRAVIEVRVTPQRDGGFDHVARRICKFPEVTDVYLVSGGHDLKIEIKGESLQEIARFVASKLASIDGVIATTTHFLLKKYKESGKILDEEEEYERLKITP